MEHAQALTEARAHIDALGRPPLEALPEGFGDGLAVLHAVAEETLQERRRAETGSGWLSPFTPGGVGAPAWEWGEQSGEPGSIRILGTELVAVSGDEVRRSPIVVEADVTAALADFHAFATAALGGLIETALSQGDPADPIRLWPEHFDVATVIGDEDAGTRANYGASPGDDLHEQPYLYVGPFADVERGRVLERDRLPRRPARLLGAAGSRRPAGHRAGLPDAWPRAARRLTRSPRAHGQPGYFPPLPFPAGKLTT